MTNDLTKVKAFERDLDSAMVGLPSVVRGGRATARRILNILDVMFSIDAKTAPQFATGFRMLAPHLYTSPENCSDAADLGVADVYPDLMFASHYYKLRDFFYYTYNRPDALLWTFAERTARVKFNDRSMARQFFHSVNAHLIMCRDLFSGFSTSNIEDAMPESLVTDGALSENLSRLIIEEVELKLSGYYNLLSDCPGATFGEYTYDEFLCVYKLLVGNALAHRYFSRKLDQHGAVFMLPSRMAALFASHSSVTEKTCAKIISDLTYTRAAANRRSRTGRVDPVYFSLFEVSDSEIAMVSDDFLTHDGLIGALRVAAIRNPKAFLHYLSNPLGGVLGRRMQATFEAQGFTCSREVSLRDYDPKLPDIDLLVISAEPTLGFYVYVCEIKNPLPPLWAKDHLRALEIVPNGIAQLGRVIDFLRTRAGIDFLYQQFPREQFPKFSGGFVAVVRGLLVTSDNAGMFVDNKGITVIDYKTLERVVRHSDGDVTYINWALTELGRLAESSSRIVEYEFEFGDWTVVYETVIGDRLVDVHPTRYKSDGVDQKIAADFLAEGGHPFKSIGGNPFSSPLGQIRLAEGRGIEVRLDTPESKAGSRRKRRKPRSP